MPRMTVSSCRNNNETPGPVMNPSLRCTRRYPFEHGSPSETRDQGLTIALGVIAAPAVGLYRFGNGGDALCR